jgi:tetratricopeptide (TPR) repeat protein
MFDDGSSPAASISIERVCGSSLHVETHTDLKGRFSFQLGAEVASNIADADSSNNSLGTAHSATDGLSEPEAGLGGVGAPGVAQCQLRAAYPGYVSELVNLSTHNSLDDHSVGTIILHHLANVRGTTISLTTALAPKSARKHFQKGYQLSQRGKLVEAGQKFKAATEDYPKFAVAWFALGQVQHHLNKSADAANSYLAAISADSRYVSPYDQLALLSAERGNWQDALKYSRESITLNPVEFPSSFWYNALANYNLKNDSEAEKSAQSLVKLDIRHHFPQAETMLAEFAENRGDLATAATHLRAFLSAAPAAPNAADVKQQLARLEAVTDEQAKSFPALSGSPAPR